MNHDTLAYEEAVDDFLKSLKTTWVMRATIEEDAQKEGDDEAQDTLR